MEHILDAKITKVYDGPSGESKHGAWQIYNLYLDKGDKKFSYFHSGKKPIPKEGMHITHLEYELEVTEKEGETYQNYKIKKMEIAEGNKAPETSSQTTSQPKTKNPDASYYVAYAKDIAVAMIATPEGLGDFEKIALMIATVGLKMQGIINKDNAQNTPSESPEGGQAASKPEDDRHALSVENEQLSTQLQAYAKTDKKKYFEILGQHGATRASEVYEFATGAQVSLLDDLEKELGDIPF